jgi:hypothetical protein
MYADLKNVKSTDLAVLEGTLDKNTQVINDSGNEASMCEAVDCLAEATTTIEIGVGNHRTVLFSLCDICVNKFKPGIEGMKKID